MDKMTSEEFNAKYPTGTRVRFRNDSDSPFRTGTTTSKAGFFGGHSDTVWVRGTPGCDALCVLLANVEVIPGRPRCTCGGRNDCCGCRSPLPEGETCESACRNVGKCKAMFGQRGDEMCCQWIPSRFVARTAAVQQTEKLVLAREIDQLAKGPIGCPMDRKEADAFLERAQKLARIVLAEEKPDGGTSWIDQLKPGDVVERTSCRSTSRVVSVPGHFILQNDGDPFPRTRQEMLDWYRLSQPKDPKSGTP